MPKTIIFCNTLNDIASADNLLLLKLGEHVYIPVGSTDRKDFIIGIFHSMSWPKYKEQFLDEFKLQTSKKIIVVASSALSMGVNFPDVRYVIKWGPARTLLDQLQEAGRAGRDGELSHIITIYHGHQLSHCEDEIIFFVKTAGCYRVTIYKPFDPFIAPLKPGHGCCSNCTQKCNCDKCGTNGGAKKLPFEGKLDQVHESEQPLSSPFSNEDKKDLRAALNEVSLGSHGSGSAFGAVCTNCFSPELVEDIVRNCHNLFTIQDIVARNLPVYSIAHGLTILEIIQEIFEDIPNFDCALGFFAESANYCPEYEHTDIQDEKYFVDYFELPNVNTNEPEYV